ncbi:hypothetical protein Tco_0839975 [Tanacetum coccineum]|uniref:Uncharacterized protein n=1 Tax=Tanacetum coccineum TaxID=301880 RepID=A0ABQ5AT30_9ASTR
MMQVCRLLFFKGKRLRRPQLKKGTRGSSGPEAPEGNHRPEFPKKDGASASQHKTEKRPRQFTLYYENSEEILAF